MEDATAYSLCVCSCAGVPDSTLGQHVGSRH